MYFVYIYGLSIFLLMIFQVYDISKYKFKSFRKLSEVDKYNFIFFQVMLSDARIKKMYLITFGISILLAPLFVLMNLYKYSFGENASQKKKSVEEILSMFNYDLEQLVDYYNEMN